MKKFLCSTLISLLVITPGLSTSAFADTNYSINTIKFNTLFIRSPRIKSC